MTRSRSARTFAPLLALAVGASACGALIGINSLLGPDGNRIGEDSRAFLDAALEVVLDSTPDLRRLNLGDEKRGDLADAILDWIDADDATRIGTPEATFYERADGRPLDRPLLSLDELATVPGMDPLLLETLQMYFSPYPRYPTEGGGGGVNPETVYPPLPRVQGRGEYGRGRRQPALRSWRSRRAAICWRRSASGA